MNARTRLLVALSLGLTLASAASGFDRQSALGAKGEIFVAHVGRYADLFPNGRETDGKNVVLSLDLIDPVKGTARILVPGTANTAVEQLPFLLYEESSATLFMVWQVQVSGIHPILNLGSFHDGQWGAVIPVMGDPFAKKSAPQLGVTRESYAAVAGDGAATTVNRTVLHLIWAEENAAGTQDAFYTPIIFDDGKYLGSNPIYRLNDYDQSPAATGGPVPNSLLVAPRLQTGTSDQTMVVTFADAAAKRLVSIEVGVLPRQLSALADGSRAQIIDVGVKLYPKHLQQLADAASAAILAAGTSFYPEFVHTMADRVHDLILNDGKPGGGRGLKALADGSRAQIIDVGVKLGNRGLVNQSAASTAAKTTIEEIQSQPADSTTASETHLLQVQVAASRPVPPIGDGAVVLYSSEDGQKALVSWQQDDKVQYTEAPQAGWSDVHAIPVSDQLTLDKVQQLLEHRVRQ